MKKRGAISALRPSLVLLVASLFAPSCHEESPQVGSETHFLRRCLDDTGCSEGLHCFCGRCSIACDDADACSEQPAGAYCAPIDTDGSAQGEATCAGDVSHQACDFACTETADCAALGGDYRCSGGACRAPGLDCERGQSEATEVAILGDLVFADSGLLVAELEALATASGALPDGEHYRDYTSKVVRAFGQVGDVPSQYETAKAEGVPKVLILNAGGADVLVVCPDPLTLDCPALQNALDGTQSILATAASDGVESVVFLFYPDPVDVNLKARFDLLRPEMESLCAAAPLDCAFLDARPIFTGHEAELLDADQLLPTAEGSKAWAEATWSLMEQWCWAQ